MESLTFWLTTLDARKTASAAVAGLPVGIGLVVEVREETRSLDQNAALHAALTDISRQVQWHGKRFNVVTWKRLTMAAFLREIGQQPELIPALDGKGFDVIFEKTSRMGKKMFSQYLEWVYAFGASNGVVFRDNRHAAIEELKRTQ